MIRSFDWSKSLRPPSHLAPEAHRQSTPSRPELLTRWASWLEGLTRRNSIDAEALLCSLLENSRIHSSLIISVQFPSLYAQQTLPLNDVLRCPRKTRKTPPTPPDSCQIPSPLHLHPPNPSLHLSKNSESPDSQSDRDVLARATLPTERTSTDWAKRPPDGPSILRRAPEQPAM